MAPAYRTSHSGAVRLVELQRAYRNLAWDTHGTGRIAVTARDCPAVHIYDVNSMQVGCRLRQAMP